jgi:methylenetetrahydrofolate reductase (NADPH)
MTRIADLLAKGRTYSFEFFPPKTDAEQTTLVRTLRDLEPLGPSFVSVTYLVTGMLRTTTLVPMAHLICVAHTRLELAEILVGYRMAGVENLMALGGDPPSDPAERVGELAHASELVELASAIGGFSVGVAAQPACHPLSPDVATDRDHLAAKLSRADFAVTQFFFEASDYTGLVADLADRGVDKPVLPGIMPVTSLTSVPRMAAMGAAVPPWMVDRLQRADRQGGPDAVRRQGVAIATELCRQLLAEGVPGLHFYTLNRSKATREIYSALDLAAP